MERRRALTRVPPQRGCRHLVGRNTVFTCRFGHTLDEAVDRESFKQACDYSRCVVERHRVLELGEDARASQEAAERSARRNEHGRSVLSEAAPRAWIGDA